MKFAGKCPNCGGEDWEECAEDSGAPFHARCGASVCAQCGTRRPEMDRCPIDKGDCPAKPGGG